MIFRVGPIKVLPDQLAVRVDERERADRLGPAPARRFDMKTQSQVLSRAQTKNVKERQ